MSKLIYDRYLPLVSSRISLIVAVLLVCNIGLANESSNMCCLEQCIESARQHLVYVGVVNTGEGLSYYRSFYGHERNPLTDGEPQDLHITFIIDDSIQRRDGGDVLTISYLEMTLRIRIRGVTTFVEIAESAGEMSMDKQSRRIIANITGMNRRVVSERAAIDSGAIYRCLEGLGPTSIDPKVLDKADGHASPNSRIE